MPSMSPRFKKFIKRAFIFSLLFCCVAAISLSAGCSRCSGKGPPNVIFITVDTLRADHLSGYGHERKTSPYMDELAQTGVVFRTNFAQSSKTGPSMASIFTGLNPDTVGLIDNGKSISKDVLTMAEIFRQNGYKTGCVQTNPYLEDKYNFDQGFEDYKYLYPDTKIEVQLKRLYRADKVNAAALDWLENTGKEKPYFLYLHYMSPHCPYLPPSPYDIKFDPGFDRTLPDFTLVWRFIYGRDRVKITEEYEKIYQERYTEEQILDHMVALYDGEILYFDSELEKFLGVLRENGRLDNTLVVISSDHGEEFKEHGGLTHGKTVFQEVVHVPLILYFPGRLPAGKTVRQMTRNLDILPTVLDIAGIEVPPHVEGKSLTALWTDEAPLNIERSFAHIKFQGVGTAGMGYDEIEHASVTTPKWRYISDMKNKKDMLFDRREDPGDLYNVADKHPETVKRLSRELLHYFSRSRDLKKRLDIRDPDSVKLDQKEKNKLEALGYFNK